jgi:Flp pilus assembly protein TadG
MTFVHLSNLARSDRGSTAVEFALVFPALAMFMLGTVTACLLMFSTSSLHYAVEQAARCYSVNSSQCGSASTAQTYAKSLYRGANSPTFTAATPACGHQVSGSVNIVLSAIFVSWSMPVNAVACFP